VRGKFLSSQEEDMHRDQDLTAVERLKALAELFARGVDRLAMQRMRKHARGKAGSVREKYQVVRSRGGIG
jgi:hypothetical protein